MKPNRSRRAWLPAAICSVGMLVALVVVQLVNHFALDDRQAPRDLNAPWWRWPLEKDNQFFGPDPLRTDDHRFLAATVAMGAVIVLVGFVLTAVAVRGLAPGSGVLALFLSGWMALTVATSVACVAGTLIRLSDLLGQRGSGDLWFEAAVAGVTYGARLGWLPALLAALVWVGARPKPAAPVPERARPEPEPPWVRDPATGGAHAGDPS